MTNKIYFIDVTNRDGVQTSRILLSKLSKTMINLYLGEMGVFQSEIGFPTLRHEVNYINANIELAKAGAIRNIRLQGWCRAIEEDVSLALKNCPDLKHLNLSASTSDIMIRGKFQGKKGWDDIVESMQAAVRLAKHMGIESVGIKGLRHVYDRLGISFHSDPEARSILELVQYANLHMQKPLTDDELRLIASYPEIVRKILTMTP